MSLTRPQIDALLRPIHPSRVLKDNKGMAHVSQQDVRAHLTRIFGFGGWSSSITNLTLVHEGPGKDREGKDKGWAVTYRATVRLDIRDPQGQHVCSYEDVATGTSPNLPTLGDGHDFAAKVAVSMALKRAATNLGDGYGLSLYNKGQLSPLVIGTLVLPDGEGVDVQEQVPQQVSMGHDDAGSAEQVQPDVTAHNTAQEAARATHTAQEHPDVQEDPTERVAAFRDHLLAGPAEGQKPAAFYARAIAAAARTGMLDAETTDQNGVVLSVKQLIEQEQLLRGVAV